MSADKQNFSLYAGDDCVLSIAIKDESGIPLSLIGASFTWKMAQTAGSAASVTKTSPSGGIAITDAANGLVSVTLSHTDTASYQAPMWHQLVMTDAGGNVSTVTTGTVSFKVRS